MLVEQVAVRNTQQGVFYFNDAVYLPATFQEVGGIDASSFVATWKALPLANELSANVAVNVTDLPRLTASLAAANIHLMAQKAGSGPCLHIPITPTLDPLRYLKL